MDYQTLDKEIDELEHLLSLWGISKSGVQYKWERVFDKCREIQEGFNAKPHYPTNTQQESAWARFNQLRSQAHNDHRDYKKRASKEICHELLHDLMLADHDLVAIIA